MMGRVQVYVRLLDENVDVWRPVQAEQLRENVYKLVDQPYDRATEKWQFEPGDVVVCDIVESYEGRILAAIRGSAD
jgi:hypothetical protein